LIINHAELIIPSSDELCGNLSNGYKKEKERERERGERERERERENESKNKRVDKLKFIKKKNNTQCYIKY